MSNEELAAAIQRGESEALGTLWQQVENFIGMLAFRICGSFRSRCDQMGVTDEDLIQIGFIALVDAVKAFDPAKGYKLTAYIAVQCKRHFYDALGLRLRHTDLLCGSKSLDEVISPEDGKAPLLDVIPDPESEKPFEDVVDNVWRRELREAEDWALGLIDPRQADVLRRRYFKSETLKQIADADGFSIERIRQLEKSGLRSLRRRRLLQPFHDDEYQSLGLCGVGVSAFRHSGCSATERAVEKLERKRAAIENVDKS